MRKRPDSVLGWWQWSYGWEWWLSGGCGQVRENDWNLRKKYGWAEILRCHSPSKSKVRDWDSVVNRAAVKAKVGGTSLGVIRGLVLFPEEGRWLDLLDPFSMVSVRSHRVCALGIVWEVCPLFCDPVLDKTTLIIPIHFLGLWSQELMYALGSLCKYPPAKAWQDR